MPIFLYYLWMKWFASQFWLLVIIQFIILPFSAYYLKEYTKIREDFNSIVEVNKPGDVGKKYPILNFLLWFYNQYLIWMVFAFLFVGILLWIKFNFNLLTIAYVHISWVIVYLSLNLISNKFPPEVIVKFNNSTTKWFLLELSKERAILWTKKANYIIELNKIDHIKIIKKSK